MNPSLYIFIYMRNNLELEARDDEEGVGHGVDVHPLATTEELKAGDGALLQHAYEVGIAVLRHP